MHFNFLYSYRNKSVVYISLNISKLKHKINSFKMESNLFSLTSSSYRAVNTLRLGYKNQSVNAV